MMGAAPTIALLLATVGEIAFEAPVIAMEGE
jgi:hypothetical protein